MQKTHPKLLLLGWILLAIAVMFIYGDTVLRRSSQPFPHPTATLMPSETRVPPVESSGVTMRWLNGYPQWGDHYRVELCYTLPDQRDWLLSNPFRKTSPLLKISGQDLLPIEEGTMYWRQDAGSKVVERCSYLLFFVGQPASGKEFLTLQVRFLIAPQSGQTEVCQPVRDIQGERGENLTMSCIPRKGFPAKLIERLPLFLLQNDAVLRRPMESIEWDTLEGEWTFTFPVAPP